MAFTSPGAPSLKLFTNCQICLYGELIPQDLYFSPETGLITPNYYYRADGIEKIDLQGAIVAPGFLDLQTNGLGGVHFTSLGKNAASERDDIERLGRVAGKQLESGVTGWWATIPTVDKTRWKQVLPHLRPRTFADGAALLGAHVEGPYLHPVKKGAHNAAYLAEPSTSSPEEIYSEELLSSTIRLVTLAPELPGSIPLIGHLKETYPHIAVSVGHSIADYDVGLTALDVGATAITHVFNAMQPLHHRDPGLAGLMATGRCFYSVIPDGIHLHPSIVTIALRTNPTKCMLVTDSIELAGLPDGLYPGHGQIPQKQRKVGNKVTIEGTDTLVGSCILVDECVRRTVEMTGCNIAEAVRCVTENVATMMGETKRGVIEPGRRADFAIIDPVTYTVKETWIEGKKVFEKD